MNVQDIPRGGDDYASVALIDAATALLAKRKRDIPDDFLAKLFGLAVPEDLARYTRRRACRHRRAIVVVSRRAQSRRRPSCASSRPPRRARHSGARNRQRRHAVSGRFRRRRTQPARPRHPPVRPSGVRRRARPRRQARRLQGRAHGRRPARKLHPHPHRRHGRRGAAGGNRPTRSKSILAEVRVCVQDWQPMLARIREHHRRFARPTRRRFAVDEIAEAIQFLEWMADDNFTLLGARDYVFTDSDGGARTGLRDRPRPVALARHAAAAALERAARSSRRKFARSSRSRGS